MDIVRLLADFIPDICVQFNILIFGNPKMRNPKAGRGWERYLLVFRNVPPVI